MNWKQILSFIVNIGYILGFVVAKEQGFALIYFVVTTTLMVSFFHKKLWFVMKKGGDMYADWCREKATKINDKVFNR